MNSKEYGRSLSTVFGHSEKQFSVMCDEDDDPIIDHLRMLDHRYMRFAFHPLKDKFVLSNSWKDPAWTDVKSIRAGIDSDEKENRELVLGKNLIDIKQKTIPQLLLDEVCYSVFTSCFLQLMCLGIPSLLRFPNRKSDALVTRPILLLCCMHILDFRCEHYNNTHRDSFGQSTRL